ncbi:hypothetical protein Dimus_036809, partial [Dionaea muscipula]
TVVGVAGEQRGGDGGCCPRVVDDGRCDDDGEGEDGEDERGWWSFLVWGWVVSSSSKQRWRAVMVGGRSAMGGGETSGDRFLVRGAPRLRRRWKRNSVEADDGLKMMDYVKDGGNRE